MRGHGLGLAPTAAVAAAAFLLSLAPACAADKIVQRADQINIQISRAKKYGAQSCAPIELAMAESHREFALAELKLGRYHEARAEMELAGSSVDRALQKSPEGRCVGVEPGRPRTGDQDGDGFPDDKDRCPQQAEDYDEFKDLDGCPEPDNDGDGIPDVDDGCRNEAEDRDGLNDEDGCPDLDNDGDRFPDDKDRCPTEPEDIDQHEDDDGCPDCDDDGDGVLECPDKKDQCPNQPGAPPTGCPQYKNVNVTGQKIEIKQAIFFVSAKGAIQKRSYAVLDEVAEVLKDNPKLRVRIEGHTDSRGKDAVNLRLSQARADAVRAYLITRGIAEDRLISKGFGKTAPIADNRTEAGREQNRRVEFVILGPGGEDSANQ